MKKYQRKPKNDHQPVQQIRVLTFDEAVAAGMSSSLVMTISRSLRRLAKDCFRRYYAEDYSSRYDDGINETPASLQQAGRTNEKNSYELQALAIKLRKAGK